MNRPEIFIILEHAAEQFPEQLPRVEEALRAISNIGYWPHKLLEFAKNMVYFGSNPSSVDSYVRHNKVYPLLASLQRDGIVPTNVMNAVDDFFKEMINRFPEVKASLESAAGSSAASSMSFGMGLAAVAAGMVIGTVALVHLAPEEFWDPEDNALLPLDISDEELKRNKQYRKEEKIRNHIPFCQFNEGLDRCLPTSNGNHDDESNCYVKDGQCKVNKGWIKSAYNWWKGNNTDTPLFYKNQEGALVPLTEETYHRHKALYNQDGSSFSDGWVCPICIEDTDAPVVWTRSGIMDSHGHDVCGHKYHTACINQLIEFNTSRRMPVTCTLCRQHIILPHYTQRPNPHHEGRKKSKKRLRKKHRSFRKASK
jgi:hypothetical protein